MKFKTQQENFWAGRFGDDYIARNNGTNLLASNVSFFSKALNNTRDISSCIEFGANIGMNLEAIQLLFPNAEIHAVEINKNAARKLEKVVQKRNITEGSIIDFTSDRKWDLVLIKGVLIHISPDYLPVVYDNLFGVTKRYILLCEYYNPTPLKIDYRGHKDKLFKRDFAGEMLDRFEGLSLEEYGFLYHRDNNFPQDDLCWFLLKKD